MRVCVHDMRDAKERIKTQRKDKQQQQQLQLIREKNTVRKFIFPPEKLKIKVAGANEEIKIKHNEQKSTNI